MFFSLTSSCFSECKISAFWEVKLIFHEISCFFGYQLKVQTNTGYVECPEGISQECDDWTTEPDSSWTILITSTLTQVFCLWSSSVSWSVSSCVVSPSVCSSPSSPVLGCSLLRGVWVFWVEYVPSAVMSGLNLLHLITKSQPVALKSCSLPSGPLTGWCVPAVFCFSSTKTRCWCVCMS